MDYNDVKLVHMSAVAISFAAFFARGVGMLGDAAWIRHRVAKTLPHVVDTVLIVSAIWLAWALRQGPTNAPWINAKIIGLLAYIAYNYLNTQIDKTGNRMEVASAEFVDILQEPTR